MLIKKRTYLALLVLVTAGVVVFVLTRDRSKPPVLEGYQLTGRWMERRLDGTIRYITLRYSADSSRESWGDFDVVVQSAGGSEIETYRGRFVLTHNLLDLERSDSGAHETYGIEASGDDWIAVYAFYDEGSPVVTWRRW